MIGGFTFFVHTAFMAGNGAGRKRWEKTVKIWKEILEMIKIIIFYG